MWVLPLLATLGQAQEPLNLEFIRTVTPVARGVVHEHLASARAAGLAPLNVNLLRIDLSRARVDMVLAVDQVVGQETTSSMVKRYGAVAGVNGGFSVSNDPWNIIHGDPNGFFVRRGVVLSDPVEPRAAFGMCPGPDHQLPHFVQPSVKITAEAGGRVQNVAGINRGVVPDSIVLYTPEWNATTLASEGSRELVVERGRVTRIGHGSSGIPESGFVLTGVGTGVRRLGELAGVGDSVSVAVQVISLDDGTTVPLEGCGYTSAGPVIVRDGVVITDYTREAMRDAFTRARHPRTGVGVTRDGDTLLLMVVDGRQDSLSVGMTLEELGTLLVAEGAYTGYNLDGGGSSTMVVNGEVRNSPSDGRERRRADAVLVTAGSAGAAGRAGVSDVPASVGKSNRRARR